ncbi:MAG: hypothetical protein R3Y67_02705 [Eubacteriales bacterium]
MAKEQQSKEKVVTKYEQKMAARKLAEEKDKKEQKLMKLGAIAVLIIVIAIVGGSVGYSIYSKQQALTQPYVQLGEEIVTQQEYDFYYAYTVNGYVSVYGDLVSLMGFDTSTSHSAQLYSDELTWKDYFDSMAIDWMIEVIALYNDGQEAGFTYDASTDLATFQTNLETAIEESGYTEEAYYKAAYGEYADKEVVFALQEKAIYAEAYLAHLSTIQEVSQDDIEERYASDSSAYDSVDFYLFTALTELTTDSTDEEVEAQLAISLETVEEYRSRYEAGESFEDLSVEYASETTLSSYEENGGFFQGYRIDGLIEDGVDWLYDEGRVSGDTDIIYNESAQNYAIYVFMDRYKEDTIDEEIQTTIISELVAAYLADLVANYELVDVNGNFAHNDLIEQ